MLLLVVWLSGLVGCFGFEKFNFPNFQNRPHLNLNGDARSEVGELVLVNPAKNQVGAVWYDERVDVSDGFVTNFAFTMTEVENSGADGLAFVLQRAASYAMGNSGNGMGYDGLDGRIAIEFDMIQDVQLNDPPKPHVSVHQSHGTLSTFEPTDKGASKQVENLATYDEDPTNVKHPRFMKIAYESRTGTISVTQMMTDSEGRFQTFGVVSEVQVGPILGTYYIGFTASTGETYARIALLSWYFHAQATSDTPTLGKVCSKGFTGNDCAVTNDVAFHECPRRTACNVCVEDVYNCAWCVSPNGTASCVVGTSNAIKQCKSVAVEPLACTAGLSRIWLYMLCVAFIVVIVFGILLYRALPVVQSFRAISLLVALVGGGLLGMAISFFTSVSLVEISEISFFAVAYGLFFLCAFGFIYQHIMTKEVPRRGWKNAHVVLLSACALAVLISSIGCFVLDKRIIHWLPEGPKILLYTVLGATLNFCIVFSLAEISGEFALRWSEWQSQRSNIQTAYNADKERASVMNSQARIALLATSSILSGLFFGCMFGTLRIEEESQYHVALALQKETVYTYPVGAVIGGVSAMLYQLIQLPLATDEQIDRIMRQSNDGL